MSKEIDFKSVLIQDIDLPYSEERRYKKLHYADPSLKNYSVIAIEDSAPDKRRQGESDRLTTFIFRYPRYVHSELMTHRTFSRNASSSRARSVKSTFSDVMENPVLPIFTINQRGMSGALSNESERKLQLEIWLKAREDAVANALRLLLSSEKFRGKSNSEIALGYREHLDFYYDEVYSAPSSPFLSTHKQQVNRLLEPFIEFEVVVTSSYWGNFLNLRAHSDAQPEIRSLAFLVKKYFESSSPTEKWYHLPFLSEQEIPLLSSSWGEMKPALMKSSGEAAQISYHDKTTATKATATSNLGDRLLSSGHFSPFEHPAVTREAYFDVVCHLNDYLPKDPKFVASNFDESWVQFRPMVAGITK